MKHLTILAFIFLLLGCRNEKMVSPNDKDETEAETYPKKVTELLDIVGNLKPETKVQELFELVDKTIGLPEEDVILDGGGGLGERWITIGIGAGDEWALSIESYRENGFIWEAKVIRTSISKALANEVCEVETIYPYYYQGHLIWDEKEMIKIRKQRWDKLYQQNENQ